MGRVRAGVEAVEWKAGWKVQCIGSHWRRHAGTGGS
jgi:hypothetical protein